MNNLQFGLNGVYYFKNKHMTSQNNLWSEENDELLKYFYQDRHIFDWNLISKQVSTSIGVQVSADQCRNRYIEKYGPVKRGQWTPQEQKQLYRLHNENGNKWAVISQNLLGRSDNCVKNHFYSKLRKSLRAINKIAKLHMKKEVREISDVVIYKLTEATDESLKQGSQVPKEITSKCYDLKNRLLIYEMDQKQIKEALDFTVEKELLEELGQFNKVYKKRSKKQKSSQAGTETFKRNSEKKRTKRVNIDRELIGNNDIQYEADSEYEEETEKEIQELKRETKTITQYKSLLKTYTKDISQKARKDSFSLLPIEEEFDLPLSRKRGTTSTKHQSKQVKYQYEKKRELMALASMVKKKDEKTTNFISFADSSSAADHKNRSKIQEILKAEGILQNQCQEQEHHMCNQSQMRSMSVCSQQANVDMFAQDSGIGAHFKELSSMQNESHFFKSNQNQ